MTVNSSDRFIKKKSCFAYTAIRFINNLAIRGSNSL